MVFFGTANTPTISGATVTSQQCPQMDSYPISAIARICLELGEIPPDSEDSRDMFAVISGWLLA
jgi:hypothetical protein